MAFEPKSTSKNKNLFVARLVSKKTGNTITYLNLVDGYARTVFGVLKASEITAEQAEAVLPAIMNNELVEVVITDLTQELEPTDPKDF